MADEATTATGAGVPEDAGAKAPAGDGFTPITTQEQFNAALKDRLARERAKARER